MTKREVSFETSRFSLERCTAISFITLLYYAKQKAQPFVD